MELDIIDVTFSYTSEHGNVLIKATIDPVNSWVQWGATKEELGENVHLLTKLFETAMEEGDWAIED